MLLFIYLYFLLLHNPQECTLCYEVRFGRLLKFQTSLDTKLPKPWSSKTHHNNKNNQTDTPPQIPEKNAESNKKDKVWIELEDMSSPKKKSTDISYNLTPKTKESQQQRSQRMKMEQ